MCGQKTSNNCYGIRLRLDISLKCNIIARLMKYVELCHQRLGHLNFKDIVRAFKKELILGLLKLEKP